MKPSKTISDNLLQESIKHWKGISIDQCAIETVAQTRSGSGISGINIDGEKKQGYDAIFKIGQKNKLRQEKNKVASWHAIYPGLAPQIISYNHYGTSAAILVEHLSGQTYEQILLYGSNRLLNETRSHLCQTLNLVWEKTANKQNVCAGYMNQLSKRIDDVYCIHPEFDQFNPNINSNGVQSYNQLLKQVAEFEQQYIKAPFSVYIHGDFNVDNIIYDAQQQKIKFIDLHRSQYFDYVQDISVFMVSNYRLQILDAPLRQRILENTLSFYDVTRNYAQKVNDTTFNIRLALGLARSFMTSTRFILDKTLAENMFLRSRYLLEKVLETSPNHLDSFSISVENFFTG